MICFIRPFFRAFVLTISFLSFFTFSAYSQPQCCCTNTNCINYNMVAPDCNAWCGFIGQTNMGSNTPYANPALCVAACSALPIELEYFRVKNRGNMGIEINWKTSAESDNKGFDIQRMSGVNYAWETLGFVEGQGSTFEPHNYIFYDQKAPIGINYYRLRQLDFSGLVSFSKVEGVNLDPTAVFAIWPTLAQDVVFVLFNKENRNNDPSAKILVHDLMGQQLIEQDASERVIDIRNLTHGHYLVSFVMGGQVNILRFIKVE